jgi:protein MPE1
MLNADGEYVQVMTDTKTWNKFQEKTNASRARAASADAASKELRERGLECPIDNQRFVDPVKTPCCGKTYCRECIDNALADGDLICPNCAKEDVLMDDLVADDDMVKSLKAYDTEKAAEREKAAKAVASTNESVSQSLPTDTASPSVANDDTTPAAAATATTAAAVADEVSDTDSTSSKKRKQPPTDIKPPTAPKAMRQAADPASKIEQDFIQQMEMLKNTPMGPMGMPMGMPMPMQMPQQMGFQNGYQNGYQMGFQPQQQQQQMPQQQWFPQQNFGYSGQQQYGQQYGQQQHQQQQYGWGAQGQGQGQGQGQWSNGQGQTQGQQDNNDAYDRQPVNPRGRNRRSRAPDFRYL